METHTGDGSMTPAGEDPPGARGPERLAASAGEGVTAREGVTGAASDEGAGGPAGVAPRGAAGLGGQEFVVLTENEAPPEELAPAAPRSAATRRRRKAWTATGIAAGVLGVGLVAWTTPGAGALEAGGGATVCAGSLPQDAGRNLEFFSVFTNYSSLPVTVTGATVEQTSGVEIEAVGALVRDEVGSNGVAAGAERGAPAGVALGRGAEVEVPSGKTLVLTFRGTATRTGAWVAQASDVRVDYHAWTQAPQRSVDSSVAQFSSGVCP